MQQSDNTEEVNSFARWQNDELVSNCLQCHSTFTFLLRKHHCRCCGGIFCSSCTQHFAYYDKHRVKVLQRSEGNFEFSPYRTCDSCYENLLQRGLLLSQWGGSLMSINSRNQLRTVSNVGDSSSFMSYFRNNVVKDDTIRETVAEQSDLSSTTASGRASSVASEEYSRCPICNIDLRSVSEDQSAAHIQNCVEEAANIQQHQLCDSSYAGVIPNRILVYLMSEQSFDVKTELVECPICFEEMESGQKVARLECLCVFHYRCIKSWLKKKSQKMNRSGWALQLTKNFCPLHDAIY
ncbi:phosphatidylinositol-3-phosphate-binding ubiquitin-protein ligase Ecym_3219 [Eremothecium cymbalariae DBVPG|uniref:RING-type E3 ubiquitin transferase n=1 Tax=Eremothecium cymbalariae (strain CBS 270.75 / DBVPG 7215 / KCTC 17166 / NRRL Y-17582) TaxID=931890 RepID=G8JRE7_ERECY|nr:Hypothetical protein Ecym_3219 [Eremothecium cymbalariae DBVPG\